MIVVVDSGGANRVSLCSAVERLGKTVRVSREPEVIQRASHVILPGVGAADRIMRRLHHLNLVEVVRSLTQPVLGICVGMQILGTHSAEGNTPCTGIIPVGVKPLPAGPGLILPHMGWNTLTFTQPSALWKDLPQPAAVYFVHSFAMPVCTETTAEATCGIPFSAAIHMRNFHGVQFHPERSGPVGTQILKNFLELES